MTVTARVSPWWMLPPALLFAVNFVVALGQRAPSNLIYDPGLMVANAISDLVLIGYVWLAVAMSHADLRSALALRAPPLRPAAKLAGLLVIAVIAINLVADRFTDASRQQGIAPTHDPASSHQWLALAVGVVALVVVAPVAEELVFRGLGFAALGRHALVATSILFALAHAAPVLLAPVFLAGLGLGYLRLRTGSTYTGMVAHGGLNAIALAAALLFT